MSAVRKGDVSLVSFVMPVWRPRSEWLHESVASALAETACDVELILVDDGNELPVSETLSDVDDPRLRVLRVDHCGHYAARNAGLNAARGDYVRFFDADDVVVPGSTHRLLAAARATGKDTVAYGWTMICDEQLVPYRLVSSTYKGDVAEDFLLGRFDVYIHGMLSPRSVLDRIGPWEEQQFRLMGDRDYVQRILENAPVSLVEEVVTLYRRHSASVTRSSRPKDAVQAGSLILKRYFERHPEKRRTDLERNAYRNLHVYRARQFFRLGQMRASALQLALAARHDPVGVSALVVRAACRRIALP
jgi:glycosyltransferase involved in cell wall biosynthesis